MPLYEYVCEECEETFEVLRSASATDAVTCPECGAPAKKLVSLFATGASGGGSGGGRGGCATGSSGGG